MNHLPLIIKREYLTKVRNKSFIVMTILSPIIMIALISLVAYLSALNNDKVRTIAVLDQSGLVKDVFKNTEHTSYNLLSNMSLTDAKRLVKETNASGLLYVEELKDVDAVSTHIKFYSEESPSLSLISDLETQVEHKLTDIKLQQNGVNVGMINASKVQVTISQESFTGEKSSKMDSIMKLFFGGAAGYLLFMFIIIYGNMIMRSVIEEKTSRIIEVIISSVKPIQLMLGKIIGTSLAGITQFIIWIFIGGLLITILSVVFGVETQTPQQELVNQAMANPELGMQVQDVERPFTTCR
ncbi:MAG TPA: ABC transporter permease, partial [Mariniflexile sp.]|nr:ABC transporter permease [Mariniflexile sp.]